MQPLPQQSLSAERQSELTHAQRLLFFSNKARREKIIADVFDLFTRNNFEPILIKGWSIARFYPPDKPRAGGDLDLCVNPTEYRSALDFCATQQFDRIEVDLHKGLKTLDRVPFDVLHSRSILVNCGGGTVRVLSPEDNLRVAAVHWLNDGGANQERLRDIYYLVANRPANFDWDKCLNAAGATRRNWIICAIAIAHRYLNLDVDDTPIADEIKNPHVLPAWLTKTLAREWANKTPLSALEKNTGDFKALIKQLRLRFPPNPIAALIQTEAALDNSARLFFQLLNMTNRFHLTLKRAVGSFKKVR